MHLYAHKADVLRLQVLNTYGGIYLDIDTMSLRSWRPFCEVHRFVMAWQDQPSGDLFDLVKNMICVMLPWQAHDSLF